jgi:outer membrane protein assembly factor BamB
MPMRASAVLRAAILVALLPVRAGAADWPAWGGGPSRNMVSAEKNLPTTFEPGRARGGDQPGREEIDPATTKGVRWAFKLGSQSYGNPVVAGGRVFVGTNNESPRDPRWKGDRSVLYALDEANGALLWQLTVPKLGSGKVNDWEYLGITSSPTVDGDFVYLVTNRSEVLCLDVRGQADGNAGPFLDEGRYMAGPGAPPAGVRPTDADIVWRFDMIEELGVFPHNATSSSVLVVGDRLYVTTSNGVDWGHANVPSPNAPSLVALDKRTGKLLGEESSGISARTFHSNWSSPAYGKDGAGRPLLFFGGGDGRVYAFNPDPAPDKEGLSVLPEVWRFDANPPRYRERGGKPVKYATPEGPSEVIMTPVIAGGVLYGAIGQDPEHGSGVGHAFAIDLAGPVGTGAAAGDVTASRQRWSYDKIGRSISTPAVDVAGKLLFTADFDGRVYCFDAARGNVLWKHDTRAHIWGSPLLADGKVYIGTEDGVLHVFAADRKEKLLARVDLHAPMYSTPVAANGTLYIASQTQLYAVGPAAPKPGARK